MKGYNMSEANKQFCSILWNEIDDKYKTYLRGEHNKGVSNCPECGHDLFHNKLLTHIVGFSNTSHGALDRTVMMNIECPKCFEQWHCHAFHYDTFLDTIRIFGSKHFK